ncbi:MAG TPA: PLP-dependent aminotransferase family protein [Acidimicrobiales bacterium]|nr:PLP-dependent aminotransferase family protein [Acidimicrobiales bacterium]
MGTTSPSGPTSPELFIELDRARPRGLRAQLEDGLRSAIRSGRLVAGTRLPSSRALAADLGVTRGVVVDAYEQLAAEGYVTTVQGSGTTVNDAAAAGAGPAPAAGPAPPGAVAVGYDFRTGLPDLSLFPRDAWARATRAALASMPDADLGYAPTTGLPRLRAAVASYLGRVRGAACGPEQIVICNGFAHGFSLVLAALRERGIGDVAVEVPGYGDTRRQIRWAGLRLHPVPVDGEGLRTGALAATPARAVVLTPAHQSPTGVVLSATRRNDVGAWARERDAYVIEDDYDAEYRFDRHPVGALQGMLPDRVVYHGTLSKSLAPGLRLGWLVVPPDLLDAVVEARDVTDHMTASLIQATFAEFLDRGDLDRHLRRTRRIYRERRDALVDALGRWLPGTRVQGVSAGLQAFVTLPDGWDSHEVAAAAARQFVGVYPLDDDLADAGTRSSSLIMGYGTLRPDRIRDGVRRLAAALDG